MSIKQQIENKLNEALKAKDKNTYPTLRLIVSAIKDAVIAARSKGLKEIADSEIIPSLNLDHLCHHRRQKPGPQPL